MSKNTMKQQKLTPQENNSTMTSNEDSTTIDSPEGSDIIEKTKKMLDIYLNADDTEERIALLNSIRKNIRKISPFEDPVDLVQWVDADKVKANEYNPNIVATPEMNLLYLSIKLDGYTQPIVCYDKKDGSYEVVDGFHRNRVGKEYQDINTRIKGKLPIVVINKSLDERMGSTIRHNRARGTHQIRSMSDLVIDLTRMGWDEQQICEKMGMELDEVIRLKQISGLKVAYQNHEFSKSWAEFETKYYPKNTKEK